MGHRDFRLLRLILLGLIVPEVCLSFGGELSKWSGLSRALKVAYTDWAFWILVGPSWEARCSCFSSPSVPLSNGSSPVRTFCSPAPPPRFLPPSLLRRRPGPRRCSGWRRFPRLLLQTSSTVFLVRTILNMLFWSWASGRRLAALGHPLLLLFPQLLTGINPASSPAAQRQRPGTS